MATIPGVETEPTKGTKKVVWSNMADGDVGSPFSNPTYSDKTITVVSSNYSGSTLTIQGSNDGTNYMTVNDTRGVGNALTFTANAVKSVGENPLYIRPSAGGGTGTGITVTLVAQSLMR